MSAQEIAEVVMGLPEGTSRSLGVEAANLRRNPQHRTCPWWKGFPRGRVERVGIQEYAIFHADDLTGTGLTGERVLNAFELANQKITWSLDPHEQQNPEHRAALARLLRLEQLA